ncbi:MAG: hypothetical protein CVU81_01280 [Euryarchaeota archaeon HGW-Euryarchaeota-1]|nr:MAG: hypothetical protein CVU81_01280 [Euryarchaeota archaeon HGW-Euryarchaeota-1]
MKINFLEYVEKMLKKDLISHYGHFGTRAGIFYGRYLIDLKDVEEYISLYIEYGNEKYDGVKCDEGDNKNHNENMCNIFKKYCEVKSEEYNNYVRIEVFELFNPYYEVRDIIRGLLGIPEYI